MTKEQRKHVKKEAERVNKTIMAECICLDSGEKHPSPNSYGIQLCCPVVSPEICTFFYENEALMWLNNIA